MGNSFGSADIFSIDEKPYMYYDDTLVIDSDKTNIYLLDKWWEILDKKYNIYDTLQTMYICCDNLKSLPVSIKNFKLKSLKLKGDKFDLPTSLPTFLQRLIVNTPTRDYLAFKNDNFLDTLKQSIYLEYLSVPMTGIPFIEIFYGIKFTNTKPFPNLWRLKQLSYNHNRVNMFDPTIPRYDPRLRVLEELYVKDKITFINTIVCMNIFSLLKHRISDLDVTFYPFSITINLGPPVISLETIKDYPGYTKEITFIIWCLNQYTKFGKRFKDYLPIKCAVSHLLGFYYW